MRRPICSIVLGVLGVLGSLAVPAAAQPGQTPLTPQPQPYPQPPPYTQPQPYPQPPPYTQPQPYPQQDPYAQPQPMPPDGPPQPYPQQGPPPPGTTRATFVSTGEARWDVRIDNNAVCSTPCSVLVDPMRFVTLYSQERAPSRLAVGHLPAGDVLVQAKPRSQGAFSAGVTFTSLTGMGLVTGITLASVGYGTGREGMRTAGLITGIASGVGLYFSIDLLRRSLPRVSVGPARPYVAGDTVGLAGRF